MTLHSTSFGLVDVLYRHLPSQAEDRREHGYSRGIPAMQADVEIERVTVGETDITSALTEMFGDRFEALTSSILEQHGH